MNKQHTFNYKINGKDIEIQGDIVAHYNRAGDEIYILKNKNGTTIVTNDSLMKDSNNFKEINEILSNGTQASGYSVDSTLCMVTLSR